MADYCSNKLTIKSKDEKELEKIFETILGKDEYKNKIIYNSLPYSRILELCDIPDAYCYRSFLISMKLNKDSLEISTESAWSPVIGLWLKIMDKYCKNGEFLYESREESSGLYQTNIAELEGNYIVELSPEDEESDEYLYEENITEKELNEYINNHYKTNGKTLEEKLKELEEKRLCVYYIWEYVPAEEQE